MKPSAALLALFVIPTFVTSIPFNIVNDDLTVTAKRLNEQSDINKRQLSNDMFAIVNAIDVYADEYNKYRGYSRSDFTKNIVQALYGFNPHFNYIICHPDHGYNFGSLWGVNIYNKWVSYGQSGIFTKPPGFDVVIGKNGTFVNYGDGGFENWAYIGDVLSRQDPEDGSNTGVVLMFGTPN